MKNRLPISVHALLFLVTWVTIINTAYEVKVIINFGFNFLAKNDNYQNSRSLRFYCMVNGANIHRQINFAIFLNQEINNTFWRFLTCFLLVI